MLPSDSGENTYWVIDWYNLEADGERTVKMTTFHSYLNGWYLDVPESWCGQLTVSREEDHEGNRGYIFSKWNGRNRKPEPIVTILAFTGDDRLNRAQENGRILLAEKGETAYAAVLGECALAQELSESDLYGMFHFIEVDWNTGEILDCTASGFLR